MKVTQTSTPHLSIVADADGADDEDDHDDHPSRARPSLPPVVFSGFFIGQTSMPSGELNAKFGVPYEQIPNFIPLLEHPGGAMFKITVQRVARDEMPEGGWGSGTSS